jgi:HTH-type transcriptional regulator / antitoxin HipB
MSEKKTWTELREQRASRAAVRAGYEEAQRAYDIGQQVRSLREARGLSQRELAELMGTTQSAIARLEAGGSRPSLATLERLAHALGTTIEVRFREQVVSSP